MDKKKSKKILFISAKRNGIICPNAFEKSSQYNKVTYWNYNSKENIQDNLGKLDESIQRLSEDDVIIFLTIERSKKKYAVSSTEILKYVIARSNSYIYTFGSDLSLSHLYYKINSSYLTYACKNKYASIKMAHEIIIDSTVAKSKVLTLPAIKKGSYNKKIKDILFAVAGLIFHGRKAKYAEFDRHEVVDILTLANDCSKRVEISHVTDDVPKGYISRFFVNIGLYSKYLVVTSNQFSNLQRINAEKKDEIPSFCIVTPVLNVDYHFIFTLKNVRLLQTEFKFRWLICCPEGTKKRVDSEIKRYKINAEVYIEKEGGIYGAYNTIIPEIQEKAYLPLSSGDCLTVNGLYNLLCTHMKNGFFITTGPVYKRGSVTNLNHKLRLNTGTHKIIHGHSASMLIDSEVHKKFGLYSSKFKLASDSYLAEKIYKYNKKKIGKTSIITGFFAENGASTVMRGLALKEHYDLRRIIGYSLLAEYILYRIRLKR